MPESIWEQILANLPIYVGALSAIFGVLVFIHKKLVKPAIKALEHYCRMSNKVDMIASEMVPNGGHSLKDIVHRIEKEVMLSSERYKAIMADSTSAIFETDKSGRCVWVNRTYAKVTQRMPAELMGHGWVNAIAIKDREQLVENWEKAVRQDRELIQTFSFQTPTGELIPATVHSYKMVGRDNDTLGYLGVCHIEEGE